MKELAKEYRESLKPLNQRITEIEQAKAKEQANLSDPRKYYGSQAKIEELDDRLKPLRSMSRDTREVTQVIENYYDRGYWRDERYTLNPKHTTRRYIYTRPIYDEACDEYEDEGVDAGLPRYCDKIVTHREAKESSGDVLPSEQNN